MHNDNEILRYTPSSEAEGGIPPSEAQKWTSQAMRGAAKKEVKEIDCPLENSKPTM